MVRQSSLSLEDVLLWEKVLVEIPDTFLLDLAHFIELSPSSLNYLNENLKKKKGALERKDEKLLDDVFVDQKKFLQSLAPSVSFDI